MKPAANDRVRGRRWRRRVLRTLVFGVASWLVLVTAGCVSLAAPFDYVINLPPNTRYDDVLRDPGQPTLVVLQHGLFRSAGSMWRLERALELHDYEVLNPGYPSTAETIQEHAARLHDAIEASLADRVGPHPRLCFVGHSMGGLVIRTYLEREDARAADACVFIGTPHRGAALAAKRKDWFLFQFFLGDQAALQLLPEDPLYARLGPVPARVIATVVGACGTEEGWNDDVPGDDDGTVGADEAHLPEETATVSLRIGHTRLSFAAATIRQVLHVLRHDRFDETAAAGGGGGEPARDR